MSVALPPDGVRRAPATEVALCLFLAFSTQWICKALSVNGNKRHFVRFYVTGNINKTKPTSLVKLIAVSKMAP